MQERVPADRVPADRVPADRGSAAEPRRDTARPPEVVVADGDVVLQAARSGGVELRVRNPSSIVEGYRVEFERPPPWLSVTVPEIRLLPGDRTSVRIGLDVRPDTPVVAQRLRLRVRVRPESDERVHTDVEIALVVPRIGGPVRIRTEPAVVRVKDALRGRFTVHLDNRGANHPRRVTFVRLGRRGGRALRVRPRGGRGPTRRRCRRPGAGHGAARPPPGNAPSAPSPCGRSTTGRNSPPSYG